MNSLTPKDVYVSVPENSENAAGTFSSMDNQSYCRVEKQSAYILSKEDLKELMCEASKHIDNMTFDEYFKSLFEQ